MTIVEFYIMYFPTPLSEIFDFATDIYCHVCVAILLPVWIFDTIILKYEIPVRAISSWDSGQLIPEIACLLSSLSANYMPLHKAWWICDIRVPLAIFEMKVMYWDTVFSSRRSRVKGMFWRAASILPLNPFSNILQFCYWTSEIMFKCH